MEYEPIKGRMAQIFLRSLWLKKLMFFLARQVFLRELEVRAGLRAIKRGGLKPQRILDAGTGYGQYALQLHELFPDAELESVDINPACITQLNELCAAAGISRIQARVADLLTLEDRDRFDLVLNVDVIEHIHDDQAVLNSFGRALRPGGQLLLHTPAVAESMPMEKVEFGEHNVGEHAREGYKHSMIRERLGKAGFSEIVIRPTYGFFGGIGWRLGVRFPMWLLSKGNWTLPLVLVWMLLVILPVRLLNQIDLMLPRSYGGCLLVSARKSVENAL